MIVRERETPKGLLVAACDPGLLGETFEEGDVRLTVTEEFYGGEEVDEAAVLDSLSRATVANLVGGEVVSLAVEHGFVDEANVLHVDGVQHAQVLTMSRW